MSLKTIAVVVITILLTVVLMQNNDPVKFTLLFSTVYISKLVVMTGVSVFAFILGVLVGRPKKAKFDIERYHDEHAPKEDPNTLSDEDRAYISPD